MKRVVHFTDDAWDDLFSIYDYIALNSSEGRADKIFTAVRGQCSGLSEFSERGHFPPELAGHQRTDLREIRFKPYRILYRINLSRIDVLAIFDGRRDARALIDQRIWRN